ncbi:hypothetical protein B879_04144 [Cecembia lonarensis LW9]|uniref:Uncharacterized protein n=1 Tax=Cecembia lonarensis (strain CCUG 58316 / KCTC 22772 / LW9) TaxID=1225176 RepID=K1LA70_CECL9|nr:hypothetical protein B879_04144 [Cecembia lonarensis LW9]
MIWSDGQFGRSPPGNIAVFVPVHHIQSRGMDQPHGIFYFLNIVSSGHFPSRFQSPGWFQYIHPPRGNRIGGEFSDFRNHLIHNRSMDGLHNFKFHGILSFDRNGLCSFGQRTELVPIYGFIRVVGVKLFFKKVLVIVFKHGQSNAMVPGMAHQSERHTGQVVAIIGKTGIFYMRFVPYRRLGESDVCIIEKKHFTRCCSRRGDYPGIAAFQKGDRQFFQHGLQAIFQDQFLGFRIPFRVMIRNHMMFR